MSHHGSAENFERAGAQAAKVLGRFLQLASEFDREVSGNDPVDASGEQTAEDLRAAGEQLRRFRESAGYTLNGFASALEEQLKFDDISAKIDSVENGKSVLPANWAQAVAAVLAECDMESLFSASGDRPARPGTDPTQYRRDRLAQIIADDEELTELSDENFERLVAHLEGAYASAKKLIAD